MSPNATIEFDFSGCTVLVSGGTSNLGYVFASAFARAGASVGVLGGSNAAALEKAVDDLRDTGVPVSGQLADLADAVALEGAVSRIVAELGPIDVLVNNAGVRSHHLPQDLELEEWDHTVAVNLRAPYLLARQLMPSMMERGFGRVINVSGLNVWWASPETTHVGASKAGLLGLTTSLAAQGASRGVTVNSIVPGFVDTPSSRATAGTGRDEIVRRLVPMGRAARMEEIVDTGLFLASDSASYITGQTLTVSGGASPMVAFGGGE